MALIPGNTRRRIAMREAMEPALLAARALTTALATRPEVPTCCLPEFTVYLDSLNSYYERTMNKHGDPLGDRPSIDLTLRCFCVPFHMPKPKEVHAACVARFSARWRNRFSPVRYE